MRRLTGFFVLLLCFLLILPAATALAQENIQIQITPDTGAQGTLFDIAVSGLTPDADYTVAFIFDGSVVFSSEKTADPGGVFTMQITTSDTDPVGEYLVEVSDANGVVGEGSFTLTDEVLITSNITVSPPAAPIGQVQTVIISDLTPDETITVEIASAETGELLYRRMWTADAGGRVRIDLFAEEGDIPGLYYVTASAQNGTVLARGELTLEAPLNYNPTLSVSAIESGDVTNFEINVRGVRPGAVVRVDIIDEATDEVVYTAQTVANQVGQATAGYESDLTDASDALVFTFYIDGEVPDGGRTVRAGDVVAGAASLVITPPSGPIGTNHDITINGLVAGETVEIDILFGGSVIYTTERTADASGSTSVTIFTETGDPEGTYSVNVRRGSEVVAEGAFTAGAAQTGGVAVSVEPSSGPAGTDHTITVTGLNPGETITVEIVFEGTVVLPTELTADNNGIASTTIFSEDGDPEGTYDVNVVRDGTVVASATLTIGEAGPPPATTVSVTVDPNSGPIGTDHVITVSGLNPGETVAIELSFGGSVVYTTNPTADNSGIASVTIFTEDGDPEGVYSINVVRNGSVVASSAFTAGNATPPVQTDATLTIVPDSGPIGTQHDVQITGLTPGETITVVVSLNGQSVYTVDKIADSTGAVNMNLFSEPGDPTGTYTVEARRQGTVIAQGAFTVQGDVTDNGDGQPDVTPPPVETASPVDITLAPATGAAGTTYTITITGLNPMEQVVVDVSLEGNTLVNAERRADANGTITMNVASTPRDVPGVYSVRVLRTAGITELTITPAVPIVSISPLAGPIGTQHTFDIAGLDAGETVTVEVVNQDAVVLVFDVTADGNGTALAGFATENGDPFGVYDVLVVRGDQVVGQAQFEVTGDDGSSGQRPLPVTEGPSVTIEPDSVTPGTEQIITVFDLEPGETVNVNISFNNEQVYTSERVADDAGVVTLTIVTEAGDPAGTYTVSVVRNGEVVAQTSFVLEIPQSTAPTIAIAPPMGPAETTHTITISNLQPNEAITVSISFNNATVYSSERVADANGVVSYNIVTEASDAPGTYTVSVARAGEVVASTQLIIQAAIAPPKVASIEVIPQTAAQGSTHTVRVTGLEADESFSVTIEYNGATVYETERIANTNGNLDFNIVTELSDPTGNYIANLFVNGQAVANNNLVLTEGFALQAPVLVVAPTSAPAGTTHTVIVYGLKPNEEFEVQVVFGGEAVYTTERTADDSGGLTFEIETEATDAPGDYAVYLLRNGVVATSGTLTIEPGGAVIPSTEASLTVTPESGPPETTHTIDIADLNPDETVTVQISFGGSVIYETERTADNAGVVSFPIVTESGDSPGDYTVELLRDGDVVASATLTITGASEASISVDPISAPQGTEHTVTVSGVAANSDVTVEITFNGREIYSTDRTADASGSVSFPIETEAGDTPGDYDVSLIVDGDTVATTTLTIEAALDPEISVDPASAPQATEHTVTVSGVAPNSDVTVEITFNGREIYSTERTADSSGSVSFPIVTEADDTPGNYDVSLIVDGDTVATTTLTIEAALDPEISVDPASAPQGSEHTVTVSGVAPNSTVTVEIAFAGSTIYSTERTADSSGELSFPIETEAGDTPGDYDVSLVIGGEVAASVDLTILPPLDPEISVDPASAPQGSEHTISASDLIPGSTVTVEITFAGSTIYSTDRVASTTGTISFPIVTEDGDAPGDYAVSLIVDGETVATATFAIQPLIPPEISVDPASGPQGTTHTITASNLQPDTVVVVQIVQDGEEIYSTERVASANGLVVFPVITGDSDAPGDYTVNLLVNDEVAASTQFTIEAEAEAEADTSDSSSSTAPGTMVRTGTIGEENPTAGFVFGGKTGQIITVTAESNSFDPYIQIIDTRSGDVLAEDDDSGDGNNAFVEYELPEDASYTIIVTSDRYVLSDGGSYSTGEFTVTMEGVR